MTPNEAWAALAVQDMLRRAFLQLAANLERQARELRRLA